MRVARLVFGVVAMAVVLAGAAGEVRAAGGNEACLVTSFAEIKNADKIKGSAVLTINDWTGPNTTDAASSITATLTLSYRGKTAVFHVTDSNPGTIVSAESVMCGLLDLNPTTATTPPQTIFSLFGIPQNGAPSNTLKLCLIVQPNTQSVLCQSIEKLELSEVAPNTWTAVVDKLTIYVVP